MPNKSFGFNNTKPVNFSKRLELGKVQDVENPNTGIMEIGVFQQSKKFWCAPRTMTTTQRYQLEQAGHEDRFQVVIRGRFTDTTATHAMYRGTLYRIADTSVDQRNYYDALTIITLEDNSEVEGNG